MIPLLLIGFLLVVVAGVWLLIMTDEEAFWLSTTLRSHESD